MGGCYKPKKENVVKLKKYLTKDKKQKDGKNSMMSIKINLNFPRKRLGILK